MDVAKFDSFYTETAHPLTRVLYLVLGGDLTAARHATHLAYAQAWQNWSTVSRLPDPATWVRTMAYQLAAHPARRLTRPFGGARPTIPTEVLVYAPRHEAMLDALLRLTGRQRLTLVPHSLLGVSLAQVATEIRSTVGAAEARLADSRATLAQLLPHLAADPAGTPGEDPLTRFLAETAAQVRPGLLSPAAVRGRIWRRRYAAVVAMVGLATLVTVGLLTLTGGGGPPAPGIPSPEPSLGSASPHGQAQRATGGGIGTGAEGVGRGTAVPGPLPPGVSQAGLSPALLGATTARARDIPPTRRDLGFLVGWFNRDGGTFIRFDRALLHRNGSIENNRAEIRNVPLSAQVIMRGGAVLPKELTSAQLLELTSSRSIPNVVFVLHYDDRDQVDEIRELLRHWSPCHWSPCH